MSETLPYSWYTSVQRGMASGLVEHGRLRLNAEPLLAAFQRCVSERL